MKVFISWSGEPSRTIALAMRTYLSCMIQKFDVFMSEHDIGSGRRWSSELSAALAEAKFGIMCLTPDNVSSPWILFEAGALTKHLNEAACGVLFGGLAASDLTGPLAQFQHR